MPAMPRHALKTAFAFTLLGALAACGSEAEPDPAAAGSDAQMPSAGGDQSAAGPGNASPDDVVLETPVGGAAATIPSALQGRWGMTQADCDPSRADNKGLMVVNADALEFYESRGTLDDIAESGSTRIRADFDFEGEGMTWEREMVLDAQDGGNVLIRRDYGDDAMPGPMRYTRCS